MTREEQITYKAGSIADGCIAHGAPWKEYYQGFIEGAKWADANPSQPSLPSNLDEAAEEYANRGISSNADPYEETIAYQADKDAFKAGAKWRERQILKLPDNLGKAAEEYLPESHGYFSCGMSLNASEEEVWSKEQMLAMFKAGAEWMAGQGVIVEGRIVEGHREGYPALCLPTNMDNRYSAFRPGDKVVVQIRKK